MPQKQKPLDHSLSLAPVVVLMSLVLGAIVCLLAGLTFAAAAIGIASGVGGLFVGLGAREAGRAPPVAMGLTAEEIAMEIDAALDRGLAPFRSMERSRTSSTAPAVEEIALEIDAALDRSLAPYRSLLERAASERARPAA